MLDAITRLQFRANADGYLAQAMLSPVAKEARKKGQRQADPCVYW
jgi:hypothetical protein